MKLASGHRPGTYTINRKDWKNTPLGWHLWFRCRPAVTPPPSSRPSSQRELGDAEDAAPVHIQNFLDLATARMFNLFIRSLQAGVTGTTGP